MTVATDWRRLTWSRRAWALLPGAMLATLAGVTFWMVQNAPIQTDARDVKKVSATPDTYLYRFTTIEFDQNGHWRLQIRSQSAKRLADQDTYEVVDPRIIRGHDSADDAPIYIQAQRARFSQNNQKIELLGQATISSQNPGHASSSLRWKLQGEQFLLDNKTQVLQSDLPMALMKGADKFEADRMVAKKNQQLWVLEGRVRGTLNARGAPSQQSRSQ